MCTHLYARRMASAHLKPLAFLISVPLAIATATGLLAGPIEGEAAAGEPEYAPVDDHTRPAIYDEQELPDELLPEPSANHVEYPLAVAFNPADPSNYTPGGIVSHDYVVVHTMQGYYLGAQSWFQNPAANVSAHFCMRSEDGEVTQMVHLDDRAWHVGGSNSYAIGIEHEGFIDEPAWYTWETYSSSAMLARWIADTYDIPLTRDHIVGHVELPNQSHTDPGIHWDWARYMALITDLVSEGEIEGYVVDRSRSCTITATADTWIKKTLESSADLSDTDKCFIPSGSEITYLHATGDLAGHQRLSYEASGTPCEGFLDLDTQGYIFPGHFTPTCAASELGAAGVEVILDGGVSTTTDSDGYFRFSAVGAGAHSVDVLGGEAYGDAMEPVDLDVFPGARAIIAVDALDDPDPGDTDGGTDTDGTDTDATDTDSCYLGGLGCPCTDGGGCDPGLVCDETNTCSPPAGESDSDSDSDSGGGGTSSGANAEDGFDYVEADSCSVAPRGEDELPLLAFVLLVGGVALRRRDDRD